jgi:hypothetical protein
LVLVALWPTGARAGDLAIELEAGGEYDSNATRATGPERIGSGLTRFTATALAALAPTARQRVTLAETLGAKLFFAQDAQGENVAINDTHLAWGETLAPRLIAEVAGDYYDAFQQSNDPATGRAFRAFGVGPRLTLGGPTGAALTASAGYRGFRYKPDAREDYDGPTLGVALRQRWITQTGESDREWQLDLAYQVAARAFDSDNYATETQVDGTKRSDVDHVAELRGTFTGTFLIGLGYGVQWNRSTSYGSSFLRHAITIRAAAPLVAGLSLAAKGTLQILELGDPLPIDPVAVRGDSYDNENRSSVEAALTRVLYGPVDLVARYSYFTSALGGQLAGTTGSATSASELEFSRHLFFVGLGYRSQPSY